MYGILKRYFILVIFLTLTMFFGINFFYYFYFLKPPMTMDKYTCTDTNLTLKWIIKFYLYTKNTQSL